MNQNLLVMDPQEIVRTEETLTTMTWGAMVLAVVVPTGILAVLQKVLQEVPLEEMEIRHRITGLVNHTLPSLTRMSGSSTISLTRPSSWWECLPLTDQTYFRQDWEHMMVRIHIQFLDLRFSRERLYKFESMFFHQKGHANEDPIDFFQSRVRHHMFLHPDDLDGPGAVDHILRNQPIKLLQGMYRV